MYQRSMVCISAERHASEGHIAAYEKDTGSFCMVPYVPPCAKGEPHRIARFKRKHRAPMGFGDWYGPPVCVDCGIAASEVKP